jgi:cytochrome c biogenesis protein
MNLQIFRSVRFNIGLFVVLAGASALGTFLPQKHEVPEKVEQFLVDRPRAGKVLDSLGFFNVYFSYWYIFLLGLMAFDVTVCKLRGLPRAIHDEDTLEDRLIQTSPFREEFTLSMPLAAARDKARQTLGARSYKFRERTEDGEIHLWAARHRLQRWGDFLLHVTLVIVLWGGALGKLFGFEEFLPVPVGNVKSLENRPWTVAVDDFEVEYYEGTGIARKYASHLRVVNPDGRELARKRIVVNDPLDIGGVRFYQASWGMTGMFKKVTIQVGSGTVVEVPWKERVVLDARHRLSVEAAQMFPDFTVTPDRQATTQGMEPNNPAALLRFYEEELPVASVWVMKNHPNVCFKVLPDGRVEPQAHPPFKLLDYKPVLFTGLQVTYDPGVKMVGFGCLVMLFGLGIHFYLHQRRLRVWLVEEEGATRVRIGGWNSRSKMDFEPEFRALMASLKA